MTYVKACFYGKYLLQHMVFIQCKAFNMESTASAPSKVEIWKMFDKIALTYDRVNRAMTCGADIYWRKKIFKFLPKNSEIALLDCATGTADQLISLMERCPRITRAVGIDLSP